MWRLTSWSWIIWRRNRPGTSPTSVVISQSTFSVTVLWAPSSSDTPPLVLVSLSPSESPGVSMVPASSTTWSVSPRQASESRASPKCSPHSQLLLFIIQWWRRTCPADFSLEIIMTLMETVWEVMMTSRTLMLIQSILSSWRVCEDNCPCSNLVKPIQNQWFLPTYTILNAVIIESIKACKRFICYSFNAIIALQSLEENFSWLFTAELASLAEGCLLPFLLQVGNIFVQLVVVLDNMNNINTTPPVLINVAPGDKISGK